MLKQLQLETELGRAETEISAIDLYDRRASHVRPNELLTSGDLLAADGDGWV
jgi:hypothetical protein